MISVELIFDRESEKKIRNIWLEIYDNNLSKWMLDSGSVPHIALAVFDEIDVKDLVPLVEKFARENSVFALNMVNIGLFPSDEGVVFLSPVITSDLLNTHRKLHQMIDIELGGVKKWEYYLPEKWVPHTTIGIEINKEKALGVTKYLLNNFKPFTVKIEGVMVIKYRPTQILFKYDLNKF